MALVKRAGRASLHGAHCGRGSDGYLGNEHVQMTIKDIQAAIDEKSGKYPDFDAVDLLIYPNSNPGHLASIDGRDEVVSASYNTQEFRRIFIYWNEGAIAQVMAQNASRPRASESE